MLLMLIRCFALLRRLRHADAAALAAADIAFRHTRRDHAAFFDDADIAAMLMPHFDACRRVSAIIFAPYFFRYMPWRR